MGLLALIATAISVGPYPVAPGDLVAFLIAKAGGHASPLPAAAETVILQIRLPRILAAVAVGAVGGEFAGWLPPDAGAVQVDAALRAVAAGLTVRAIPPTRDFDSLPEEAPVLLTPREIEVLGALGNGLTNKEVARLLGISPHTVKFHIESLFRKLGAASRAEAVAKGMRQQIVEF